MGCNRRIIIVWMLVFLAPLVTALGGREESAEAAGEVPAESEEPIEEGAAPTDYMTLYGEMGEDVPVVGFFAPQFASAFPEEYALSFQELLTQEMIVSGLYRPVSIASWLAERFGPNAFSGPDAFLNVARRERLPVNYIASLRFFRSRERYGIRVTVYPMERGGVPRFFMRTVDEEHDMERLVEDIYAEVTARLQPEFEPDSLLGRTIYINPVDVQFFQLVMLESGDFEFIEFPFLALDGVDYRPADDFIRDILAYNLHITQLTRVETMDFDAITARNNSLRRVGNYSVESELMLAEAVMVLKISLVDVRTARTIANFDFSLESLDLDYLNTRIREVARMLVLSTLPYDRRVLVSEMRLREPLGLGDIYHEGYYMGEGDLNGMLLPSGLHVFELRTRPEHIAAETVRIAAEEVEEAAAFERLKETILEELRAEGVVFKIEEVEEEPADGEDAEGEADATGDGDEASSEDSGDATGDGETDEEAAAEETTTLVGVFMRPYEEFTERLEEIDLRFVEFMLEQ